MDERTDELRQDIENSLPLSVGKNEKIAENGHYTQTIELLQETIREYKSAVNQYEALSKEYQSIIREQEEIIKNQREIIEASNRKKQELSLNSEELCNDAEEDDENQDGQSLELELTLSGYEEILEQCRETIQEYQNSVELLENAEASTSGKCENEPCENKQHPLENTMPAEEPFSWKFREFMMNLGWFIDEMNQNIGPIWFIFPLLLIFVLILKALY